MRTSTALLATAITALLSPGSAAAIPLGTLVAGGTITSDDGAVLFSDFSFASAPARLESSDPLAGLDLMLIEVEVVTWDDLRTLHFAGTIEVAPHALGRLRIVYSVHAGSGFEIVGAALAVEAKTFGELSSVVVNEDLVGDLGDAALSLAVVTGSGASGPAASAVAFERGASELVATTGVWIDGGSADGTTLTHLSQDYTVQPTAGPVPEPSAALVFGAGLALIGARVRAARPR